MRRILIIPLLFVFGFWCSFKPQAARAQSAHNTVYGDFTVDESKVSGLKPLSFEIILYGRSGVILSRQTVGSNSRYSFVNVSNGDYYIVVEVENAEVARIPLTIHSPVSTSFRQDIALEWRDNSPDRKKAGVISANNYYDRPLANRSKFQKAEEAMEKKEYDRAVSLLREVVTVDPKDFPAWSELGTAYLARNNGVEAETAYQHAIQAKPDYFLGLMDLGRVRMAEKKYEAAVEPLTGALKVSPTSAEANYLLGEAYLQMKRGSKAVGYFQDALKLEPIKMADAHLRLAALYNGAGMKDKAAAEYEQFLKKKPDYPDRKKLERYIAENKKQ
jgi:Tfp pilus assembly protein PilF